MAQMCEACTAQHELPHYEDEFELENEFHEGGMHEGEIHEGEGWLGAIGNVVGSLLGEAEGEDEFEAEDEGEFEGEEEFTHELSPIRKVYPDAMMEHLGELAAHAETEDEAAEHFLPLIGMAASKLLPLAARALAPAARKLLPKVVRAVTRATPQLTKGVAKIARTLHRQPGARPLLRAIPAIARQTVHSIAKQAAQGRTITPRTAIKTLARQTQHLLAHPTRRAHVLRRHQQMERRFHRGVGRGVVRPHWRWVWRWINGQRVRVRQSITPGISTGNTYVPGVPHLAAGAGGSPVAWSQAGATARPGQIIGGQCVCSACPACGSSPAGTSVAAPAYCRCCGQVLR